MERNEKYAECFLHFEKSLKEAHARLVKDIVDIACPDKQKPVGRLPLDAVQDYHCQFIETALRTFPDMMESLRNDLLPLCPSNFSAENAKDLRPVRSALSDWALKNRLLVDDATTHLLSILVNLTVGCTEDQALRTRGGVRCSYPEDNPGFSFTYEHWTPAADGMDEESKAFCKGLSDKICTHTLTRILNEVEYGLTPRSRLPGPVRRKEPRMVWLVKRVVEEKTAEQIASECSQDTDDGKYPSESYINREINRLAKLCAMKLPPSQGRPKKKNKKHT